MTRITTPHTTTCALCFSDFEARTSYGLCPMCYARDHLRELDRLESATSHAKRANLPVTLTLIEWLIRISDFRGLCAYCLTVSFGHIGMVDKSKGLVLDNVVPVCRACYVHLQGSFDGSDKRVRDFLKHDPYDADFDVFSNQVDILEGVLA